MARQFIIAERACRMIEADCLAHPDVETGGVLVGVAGDDGFRVPFVVPSGPRSLRSAASFRPGSVWQQRYLDYLFARFALDYIGDWHKHPSGFDRPSSIDLATARRIVASSRWNKPEAAFPIATIREGTVRIRAFALGRERQQFEELEFLVVPDCDQRVAGLLLGPPSSGKERDPRESDSPTRRPSRRRLASEIVRRLAGRLRPVETR